MSSKLAAQQQFQRTSTRRQTQTIRVSKDLNELYSFMDSNIRKQFKTFTLFRICEGERTYVVDSNFERAFNSITVFQKIRYYERAVNSLIERYKVTSLQYLSERNQTMNFEQDLLIKIQKGIKTDQQSKINLHEMKLSCNSLSIDLRHYLLRKSKKSTEDEIICCLEAIDKFEPSIIRFVFVRGNRTEQYNRLLKYFQQAFEDTIWKMAEISQISHKILPQNRNNKTLQLYPTPQSLDFKKIKQSKPDEFPSNVSMQPSKQVDQSVIQELIKQPEQQDLKEDIKQKVLRQNQQLLQTKSRLNKSPKNKHYRNLFRIILPHYNIEDIESFVNYSPLPSFSKLNYKISLYKHCKAEIFKLELQLPCEAKVAAEHLSEVQNYKHWNGQVMQCWIWMDVSSQNSAIMYQKHKAHSQWYRQRDYLYLKHLFLFRQSFYIVDKSIQNTNFVPFSSIERGQLVYSVCKISPQPNGCRLLMELRFDHKGLMNSQNSNDLTVKYLRQFANLQKYISNCKTHQQQSNFDLNWSIELGSNITPLHEDSQRSLHTIEFGNFSKEDHEVQDDFYSIDDASDEHKVCDDLKNYQLRALNDHELSPFSLPTNSIINMKQFKEERINLTPQGYSILPKSHLRTRHPVTPIKSKQLRRVVPYDNLMLKGDFVVDKSGGMKLINKALIASQNNVIKFIMSTLKKNLFSGKGLLNISLPVDIFKADSNIQRLCESMSLAPDYLQRKAWPAKDPLERFKYCITFSFTNSILYFDIEKPFNPILGETFQGFIDGCPVYAEQTSHHPPISSLYFVGRGYRIHANLEAQVFVHINSGEGVNQGFYHIEFDDGGTVLFQTPPGEVSGLAIGDRKYNIKGKSYIIDPKNQLFCTIAFEDESSIFSQNRWQFSDQMQGTIFRITKEFQTKFLASKDKDKPKPSKKDIEQEYCQVSGRWIEQLLIDGKPMYNLSKNIPHELVHYEQPLNSNSNYREDLLYRKMNDYARSQIEKERLQVVQRNDRKLREKFHGKH